MATQRTLEAEQRRIRNDSSPEVCAALQYSPWFSADQIITTFHLHIPALVHKCFNFPSFILSLPITY